MQRSEGDGWAGTPGLGPDVAGVDAEMIQDAAGVFGVLLEGVLVGGGGRGGGALADAADVEAEDMEGFG